MRVVGPNCLGVLNTDPEVALDATFAPGSPPVGGIAFASQSGAYGIAALALAARRGLGLSSFVSMGDKADLSATTSCAIGSRTSARASCCYTSSRSAILGALDRSPGG
jgi:succinyl-CoA synthetase alpha subunit